MADAHSPPGWAGAAEVDHQRRYQAGSLGQTAPISHVPVTAEQYFRDMRFPMRGLVSARVQYTQGDAWRTLQAASDLAKDFIMDVRTMSVARAAEFFFDEYGLGEVESLTPAVVQKRHTAAVETMFALLRRAENMGLTNVYLPGAGLVLHDALKRCAHLASVACTMLLAGLQLQVIARFGRYPREALDPQSPFRACPFGFRTHAGLPLELRVANPPLRHSHTSLARMQALLQDPLGAAGGDEAGSSAAGGVGAEESMLQQEEEDLQRHDLDLETLWAAATCPQSRHGGGANASGNGGGPLVVAHPFGRQARPAGPSSDAELPADIVDDVCGHVALPAHPPQSPLVQLLSFLQRRAQVWGVRHNGTHVCQRVWYRGVPTSAWEVCSHAGSELTVETWVQQQINQETNADQAEMLTNLRGGGARTLAELLVAGNTSFFPKVNPDRSLVAFRNGVAQTAWFNPATQVYQPRWMAHDDPQLGNMCAFTYVDMDMDPEWWDESKFPSPMDIPTPACDAIPQTQHLDETAQEYLWAMTGRVLAPFRVADKEQKLILIVGCAGSGKSTYIDLVQSFFPKSQVATLSTSMTNKWAAGYMTGCALYTLPEMKEHLSLEQGTIQSLVSGDTIPAEKKGGQVYSTIIEAHGIFAGNELASNLVDAGGALTRRFFFVAMDHKPNVQDGTLKARIMSERPAFFAKVIRAYHGMLARMRALKHSHGGAVSCDSVMPTQLRDMQQRLQSMIQPMSHMITSSKWFVRAPLAARQFWSRYVDHKGRLDPSAPPYGVQPSTHPDLHRADGSYSGPRPADARDYVAPDGSVYLAEEYTVEEAMFKRAWDLYTHENSLRDRVYNQYNVRTTAPNHNIRVVDYRYTLDDAAAAAFPSEAQARGVKRRRLGDPVSALGTQDTQLPGGAAGHPREGGEVDVEIMQTFLLLGIKLTQQRQEALALPGGI